MLKDKEGKILQEEEVAEHCKLYFERLLNEGFIENEAVESSAKEESIESNDATRPPTLAEIAKEIRKLMNGKAAGESGIMAELLKAGYPYLVNRLGSLFKQVWEEETVPGDWRSGVVIPLQTRMIK